MNLDENAVGRLLRMEEVIPAMERALAAFSSGKVVQPTRVMVPVAEHGGFFGLMPAYTGAASARSWSLSTRTTQRYPPTMLPSSFKPETGEPLVTMDGRLITEMRTAAVSAVATEHLARSNASVLAIIGSGVQARSHLEALRLVREFREVRGGARAVPGRSPRSTASVPRPRRRMRCGERTWWSRPRPRLRQSSLGSGSRPGYT